MESIAGKISPQVAYLRGQGLKPLLVQVQEFQQRLYLLVPIVVEQVAVGRPDLEPFPVPILDGAMTSGKMCLVKASKWPLLRKKYVSPTVNSLTNWSHSVLLEGL